MYGQISVIPKQSPPMSKGNVSFKENISHKFCFPATSITQTLWNCWVCASKVLSSISFSSSWKAVTSWISCGQGLSKTARPQLIKQTEHIFIQLADGLLPFSAFTARRAVHAHWHRPRRRISGVKPTRSSGLGRQKLLDQFEKSPPSSCDEDRCAAFPTRSKRDRSK